MKDDGRQAQNDGNEMAGGPVGTPGRDAGGACDCDRPEWRLPEAGSVSKPYSTTPSDATGVSRRKGSGLWATTREDAYV